MTQRIDITGKQFGRLTVIEYIGGSKWACRCLCGGESFVASADLRNGHTTSCGCVQKERAAQANTTHGYSRSPTYESWCKMVARCTNPTTTQYQWYGGKGVTIHAAWRASFEQFMSDMGARPGVEYELDRIDPNGNYEPNNCRWWSKGERSNDQVYLVPRQDMPPMGRGTRCYALNHHVPLAQARHGVQEGAQMSDHLSDAFAYAEIMCSAQLNQSGERHGM